MTEQAGRPLLHPDRQFAGMFIAADTAGREGALIVLKPHSTPTSTPNPTQQAAPTLHGM